MTSDLDTLADKLRLAMVLIRMERNGDLLPVEHYTPLPWGQLAESEKNQWRDFARACKEVMG